MSKIQGGFCLSFGRHLAAKVVPDLDHSADIPVKEVVKHYVGKCLFCGEDIYSSDKYPRKFCSISHSSLYHHREGTFKKSRLKKDMPYRRRFTSTEQVEKELSSLPMVIYD